MQRTFFDHQVIRLEISNSKPSGKILKYLKIKEKNSKYPVNQKINQRSNQKISLTE